MTVAWLIPEEYEAGNLHLCVTYDNREPEERLYFRLFGQAFFQARFCALLALSASSKQPGGGIHPDLY